jgi:hypothetical protein
VIPIAVDMIGCENSLSRESNDEGDDDNIILVDTK